MAVTVVADAVNATQPNIKKWTIQATADADVAAVIPHGFASIPQLVFFTALQPEFYLSAPLIGVVDATNINVTMSNAVGSGDAAPQIQVVAFTPHTRTR